MLEDWYNALEATIIITATQNNVAIHTMNKNKY